jgi:hypothetical protein
MHSGIFVNSGSLDSVHLQGGLFCLYILLVVSENMEASKKHIHVLLRVFSSYQEELFTLGSKSRNPLQHCLFIKLQYLFLGGLGMPYLMDKKITSLTRNKLPPSSRIPKKHNQVQTGI